MIDNTYILKVLIFFKSLEEVLVKTVLLVISWKVKDIIPIILHKFLLGFPFLFLLLILIHEVEIVGVILIKLKVLFLC